MKKFIFIIFIFVIKKQCFGQNAPNLGNFAALSPTSEAASKMSAVPVNIFTGVPQIGVPIYSYNNPRNGLSFNISLDYFAGGSQVAESPSILGLGWNLNAGGIITRIVRGGPDDLPSTGFMYASAIPSDFRNYGNAYYNDSIDAEQDIFQYNFNGRSGKFVIGKNGQIALIPTSKLKIIPTVDNGTDSLNHQIVAFRIITEDGVKYDFKNTESSNINSADAFAWYFGKNYFTSWSLSQIISRFNTDTIKINYTQKPLTFNFAFPQLTYVRNSDGVRTKTLTSIGTNFSTVNKISSIVFPEKTTVSFIYSYAYAYSGGDYAVSRIKISDTAFRYGYLLDYQNSDTTTIHNGCRILLKSVTPYTSQQKKDPYTFTYNMPLFGPLGSTLDTIQNQRDYWGYYNGALNGTSLIPKVNGYSWGADRNSNINFAIANSLSNFNLPDGGSIFYEYELNDHTPYTKDPYWFIVSPTGTTTTNITLNQIFKTSHQITFVLDSSITRQGNPPITGTGNVIINIKSTDGTITYASDTLSLYDLFYHGIKVWTFNVPNGTYKFEQLPAANTTIVGGFSIYVNWENKVTDNTHTSIPCGGLRVKRITRKASITGLPASIEEYKYINSDGTSSGFLGDIPKYDYHYQEIINFNGTYDTSYTVVSSEPVNNMDYAGGISVGYSRVEVIEGTASHNIGKTVYDFTTLQDVNANFNTAVFPYSPRDLKNWGIGLPKTISIYDSLGVMIKKTVNQYAFDNTFLINDNFKSLKLGNSLTIYNGDPSLGSTVVFTYLGQEYYPVTGRAYLSSTFDTLLQANGSINTSYANYSYDTNYNVIKIVSSYDKTRGLQLEKRLYYPYNYTIAGGVGELRDSSIISPVVSSENWITGDANPRILSGSIIDFQQLTSGYVKPLALYSLQANSPVSQSTIGAFNPALLNRNPTYFVKQNNFISYDNKGNLLQVQNALSGINNSVIMDYGQQYAVAKVSNAVYSDIAYTSFESDGTGNWTIPSALRDTLNSITGKKSYNLSNGNITKSGLSVSQNYLVTVWAKSGAVVNLNSVQLTGPIATQNNWNLFTKVLSGINTITVSGSGLIDELRLHPKDANMITSTYEPFVGITSTIDPNNTITYNEFDNLNRLKIVRDKDKNILKRYDYSDTAMVININPIWTFINNYCIDIAGHADSAFTDTNINSDTYSATKIVSYTDLCSCTAPGSHPDYKIVNGHCEQGIRCNTSTTYTKIINPDYTVYWVWRCVYHWKWSDNSISSDYYEDNPSPCSLTCGTVVGPV
jgi:hypothetical protein